MGAQYSEDEIVRALRETRTLEDAASLLKCSVPMFAYRARSSGPIAGALRDQLHERETSIAASIVQNKGILSKVARELGLSSGIYVRSQILRSPRLREAYMEAREGVVDTAEENVFDAVEQGNLGFSWKILQTLGKDRGYTERKELDAVHAHVTVETTGRLVELLDQQAGRDPSAVEEALRELPEGDRQLVSKALSRFASAEDVEFAEMEVS